MHRHGLSAWIPLGGRLALPEGDQAKQDALEETNPRPGSKWSLAPQKANELGDQLTRGWKIIRQLDPQRVLWQNHAPRNSIQAMKWHNRGVEAENN